MTNINLTAKETDLMIAFGSLVDEDTAAEQIEAGPVFATAEELSRFAEMEPKSVKSVANSLIKKGFATKNDEADRYELTEVGVTWAYENRPKSDIDQMNEEIKAEVETSVEDIKAALTAALGAEGATKCSALRAVANGCQAPRSFFIEAAEAVGINKGTAARQWQEGRAEGTEGSGEDRAELLTALVAALGEMAPDEIIATLTPTLTNKAIKGIIADLTEK